MAKNDETSYTSIPTTTSDNDYTSCPGGPTVTSPVDDHGDSKGPVLFDGSRRPVNLPVCPYCHNKNVRTSTRTYPTPGTWAGVAVGAIIFFPVCWVPLVVDSLKQTDHFCQSCGTKLGTIKPLEGCCVKEQN